MAANEHLVGGERKGDRAVILSQEEYAVLKAKAELYDDYVKQSRYYNRSKENNTEDDRK